MATDSVAYDVIGTSSPAAMIRTPGRARSAGDRMPAGFDVGTMIVNRLPANGVAGSAHSDWQPPRAVAVPATFPDRFEVLVYRQFGGRHLVAAHPLGAHGDDLHYLRVFIGQIRSKVEADPADPRIIRTEPGVGYRFVQD